MSPFWWRLLGARIESVPKGAQTEFVWTHAPRSWGVFVLLALVAAVVYGVFWLYRREIRTCPARLRTVLAVVRAVVLVVLALIWLGPAMRINVPKVVEPTVVVLLDDSLSMSIRDPYADPAAAQRVAKALGRSVDALRHEPPARAELVDALLLAEDGRFLRELARRGRVRVLSVSDAVRLRASLPSRSEAEAGGDSAKGEPWPGETGAPVPPLVPAGRSTNLARGLREALDLLAGNPVSGIVLVTDGQHNEGDSPAVAAERAAELGVQVHVLGLGDPARARNLKVAGVWAPESVFRGDPFRIQARVSAQGFEGRPVRIELVQRRADGGSDDASEEFLASRTHTVRGDRGEFDVTFEQKRETAGDVIYTVKVSADGGAGVEVLESDNRKSVPLRVLSERARVLLIAGAPSWDFRLVRTLLIRDKTIDLSCWLQTNALDMPQDGNTVIKKLPGTAGELFAYDVILMMDTDPSEFDEAWIERLAKFLGDHGGGMLWQAGPRHTARFVEGVRTRAVRDLLPVRLHESGRLDLRLLRVTHTSEWPVRLTALGEDHPILQLEKGAGGGRALWARLPGVFWSFGTAAAKPAAQVLLEHGDPRLQHGEEAQPLLVAGQFGPGRVVYMGFESSWRCLESSGRCANDSG